MKIAGFEFAEGARFQSGAVLDAIAVGRHIEFLRKQAHGELTPKDIIDDARNPNSPLHSFFEWDDGEAAEQYRLSQARGLIRAVVAIYVHDDKPATRVRAYVHVYESDAPHYREMSDAMSHQKTRDMILKRALGELSAWRRRYADLKEFASLIEVIDETEKTI